MTLERFFLLIWASVLLSLTACGFSPLYGNHVAAPEISGSSAEAALADIAISNIPDRSGVMLRNALIDRFYLNGYPSSPRYSLEVEKVEETKRELDLTKSSEATRSQLLLRTTIKLYDKDNPASHVMSRVLTSTNSYNILESEFATRITEDSARVSGINDLARQIELNIALYLNRSKTAQ